MFSPFDVPSGVLLLVTDQLSSPADFLLHGSLIDHLKRAKSDNPNKTVVLSVSEDLTRWKSIVAKSVCYFRRALSKSRFNASRICISTKKRPRVPLSLSTFSNASVLRILTLPHLACARSWMRCCLHSIQMKAQIRWSSWTIWPRSTGSGSLLDITRFSHALAAACRKVSFFLLDTLPCLE
jgi:hypothetical protein